MDSANGTLFDIFVGDVDRNCVVPNQALDLFLEQLLAQTVASNRAVKNEMLTIQRQRDSVYVEDLNVKYLKEISLIPSLVCTVCWRFLFPDQKKVCYKDLPSLCVRDGEILCKCCYEKTLKPCFSYRS